jgi:hypothetical protein
MVRDILGRFRLQINIGAVSRFFPNFYSTPGKTLKRDGGSFQPDPKPDPLFFMSLAEGGGGHDGDIKKKHASEEVSHLHWHRGRVN